MALPPRLPVSYNASHPRDARLSATRTWRRKEWGGLVLLGKVVGAWWRRLLRR